MHFSVAFAVVRS